MRMQLREAILPSAVLWSKACSSPAQPRRYAGVWAGRDGPGTRTSWDACEREKSERRRWPSREACTPPPQRPQAGARARGVSPPPPRRAPTGRRAWPCPRPPRARATPNGRAGRERAAAAARAPGRSREPGAPRGPLPGLSRPSVSSPRARRAFPAPARVSSLARTGGGIYLAAGATRKREEVFGSGSRSAAFTGSKGGAAKARMSGSNNYCFFLSPRCVPSTVLSNLCGSLYSHNGPAR